MCELSTYGGGIPPQTRFYEKGVNFKHEKEEDTPRPPPPAPPTTVSLLLSDRLGFTEPPVGRRSRILSQRSSPRPLLSRGGRHRSEVPVVPVVPVGE